MRAIVVTLAIAGTAASARADRALEIVDDKRVAISDSIAIEADRGRLWAVRGKTRVPLGGAKFTGGVLGIHTLHAAAVATGGSVKLTAGNFCDMGIPLAFTFDDVEARFANAAALELHHAKKFADAAAGFARAHALDPSFDLPIYNLASAQNVGGRPIDAALTLAKLFGAHPETIYIHALFDPELASLVELDPLLGVRAHTSGTATTANLDRLAYSAERRLFAKIVTADCGFSSMSGRDVAIVAADGTSIATLGLAACGETDPDTGRTTRAGAAAVARRAEPIDRLLRELGFATAQVEPAQITAAGLRFPKAKLALVTKTLERHSGGTVRAVRGDRVLAEKTTIAERATWGAYAAAAQAIVFEFTRDQPEAGCGNAPPYVGLDVIAIP